MGRAPNEHRRSVFGAWKTFGVALLTSFGAACGDPPSPPGPLDPDPVTQVRDDDRAMNAAISDARAHLEVFERALAAARPGQVFTVKKAFPTPVGMEHIWITDVERAPDGFRGRVDSDPRDVEGLRNGDSHFVARGEVTDWMVTDEQGRIWGGYTLRVLLPTAPSERRRQMEAALQPLPR